MIALMIVIIGIAMRLVPHPANVAPVAAIALFAGTYLNKKWALWVPLAIMIISDMVLGLHDVVPFTWGSFLLVALLGTWLKQHKNVRNIGFASVTASVAFFLITNFGVWLFWYPATLRGLAQCYTLALPFYRNTFIGDILYVVVFFGIYECATRLVRNTRYAYLAA